MRLTRIFVFLFVIGCAFFIWNLWRSTSETAVLSEPLERGIILESVYGIGTVKANRSFDFKPGIISTIRDLFVKEGDSVKGGQKLLELDGKVIISAPFDGTVTSLSNKVGENVFMQTMVLQMVDLQDRYVTVSLEQRAAIRVRPGQSARLSFENLREQSFSGEVKSVYSSGNDFIARINVPNLAPQILPGMTADVQIIISERSDALLIPAAAIQENRVLVKRGEKKPFSVSIKIGLVDGASAQVIEGDLQTGDRVVLPAKAKS